MGKLIAVKLNSFTVFTANFTLSFSIWLGNCIFRLGNAPVICNHCNPPSPRCPPPTHIWGWAGDRGLRCGAVTFWVPSQCQVSEGFVICKYTPMKFTIIKSRAMTAGPRSAGLITGLWGMKSRAVNLPQIHGFPWILEPHGHFWDRCKSEEKTSWDGVG